MAERAPKKRKKRLPRVIAALTHNFGAWVVGSAANPDVENPRDWDVVVPLSRWNEAAALVPPNARPNSFGGWKFRCGPYEVDVWPGELSWVLDRPATRFAWNPASGALFERQAEV